MVFREGFVNTRVKELKNVLGVSISFSTELAVVYDLVNNVFYREGFVTTRIQSKSKTHYLHGSCHVIL